MFNFISKKNAQLSLPDGSFINYQLIKKNKKTITLRVTSSGLVVSAPLLMTQNRINQLLDSKKKWIQSKLKILSSAPKRLLMQNGEIFKILDQTITIQLLLGKRNISLTNNECYIYFEDLTENKKIKNFFIKWLKNYALKHFIERANKICLKYNISPKDILLSNAKTRWGICNNKKEVRINWRLIQTSNFVIDYVICHELAHLSFMNHSKQFWAQVEHLYPQYKFAEKVLKEKGFQLYSID